MYQEEKKAKGGSEIEAKKNQEKRKEHFQNIVSSLSRALDLAAESSIDMLEVFMASEISPRVSTP